MEWMYEWIKREDIRQVIYWITLIEDGMAKVEEIEGLTEEQFNEIAENPNAYIRTAIIHDVEMIGGW